MLDVERIKQLLSEKQLTEYRLAKNTGTSTAHMSRLMTGDIKDPRFELVCKIADALDITVDELRVKTKEEAA